MKKIADSKTMLVNYVDLEEGNFFQAWSIANAHPSLEKPLIMAYAYSPEDFPPAVVATFDSAKDLLESYMWTDASLIAIIDPQLKDVMREELPDLYERWLELQHDPVITKNKKSMKEIKLEDFRVVGNINVNEEQMKDVNFQVAAFANGDNISQFMMLQGNIMLYMVKKSKTEIQVYLSETTRLHYKKL